MANRMGRAGKTLYVLDSCLSEATMVTDACACPLRACTGGVWCLGDTTITVCQLQKLETIQRQSVPKLKCEMWYNYE